MPTISRPGNFAGITGIRTLRIVRITRLVKVARLARVLRFVMALRTLMLVSSVFKGPNSRFYRQATLASAECKQ